jgi:hypothetical protein
MAETFSGSWIVEVLGKESPFLHRFVIEGSDASDGIYPGDTSTPPVSVSGPNWSIRLEWHDATLSPIWRASDVHRGAAYTLEDSLVVSLGVDDSLPLPDPSLDAFVLRCRNVDEHMNPWHPFVNPYDFTVGSVPGR